MPITLRDLLETNLVIHAHCRECMSLQVYPLLRGIRQYGPDTPFVELASRLRCRNDGMIPDVWLTWEDPRVSGEAQQRRLSGHRPLIPGKPSA